MLISLLDVALTLGALVLAIPCTVFVVECLLAVLPGGGDPPLPELDRPLRKAVMIPAHNEEVGIIATLPWANGKTDRKWFASFEFLVRQETHLKAMEWDHGRPAAKPDIPMFTEADLDKLY